MSEDTFQAPSPEYLAELLPQYDIEFFIAQGGMGAVYKGRHRYKVCPSVMMGLRLGWLCCWLNQFTVD